MIPIKKVIALFTLLSCFLTGCSKGTPVIFEETNRIITNVDSKADFEKKLSEDELKFIDMNSFTKTTIKNKEVYIVKLKKNYSLIEDFKFKEGEAISRDKDTFTMYSRVGGALFPHRKITYYITELLYDENGNQLGEHSRKIPYPNITHLKKERSAMPLAQL